ncbi:MAG: alpha-L-rhamnosidase N-terminal domain-containing protein, partial [Pseudomonadota bacterium]
MQSQIELSGTPGELRCELRPQPLGIGTARPGFSWQSMDTRTAEVESAWQILVASDRARLVPVASAPAPDLWDSGIVAGSSRGLIVSYAGVPLVSRQRVWWTVRSFDSDGLSSGFAEPACFEVGLLSNADWRGHWLSVPWQGSATDGGPVAALLRDFSIDELPLEARLYVAVLGRAVIQLNGRTVDAAVGDAEAGDPGERRRYRTLDVTRHLLPGANRLGVLLGDGAYCGNYLQPAAREGFGTAPELLLQLEWRDGAGRHQRIVSDDRWLLYRTPIVESDPVLGEAIDLRRWNPNWSVPEVPINWEPAVPVSAALQPVPLVAEPQYDTDRPPRSTTELLTLDTLEYLVPESRSPAPRPRLNGLLIDLGAEREGRLRVDGHFADGDRLLVHYARKRTELTGALDSDRFTSAAGDGELEAQLAERSFRFARLAGTVEWRDVEAIRFSSSHGHRVRPGTELLECDQPVLAAAVDRASARLRAALAGRPAFAVVTAE